MALLDRRQGAASRALASAELGRLVAPPAPRLLDAPLRARKLGDRLATVPPAWHALRRGHFAIAHAFSAEDALAAAGWPGPLVLTIAVPPRRDALAARRLRLRIAVWALTRTDILLASDDTVADGLRRWFGAESRVLASLEDHEAVYAEAAGRTRC